MKKTTWVAGAVTACFVMRAAANPETVMFSGDGETRISADKIYTHKLDFGRGHNSPNVNGVVFDSVGTSSGERNGYGWNGFPSDSYPYTGEQIASITSPKGSGIYEVLNDFNYGIKEGTMYVTGLLPRRTYEIRFYHRPWGGYREQTLTFMPDDNTADAVTFDPDNAGGDQMVIYRYRAGSDTLAIHSKATDTDHTYHMYGMVNEEVYEVVPGNVEADYLSVRIHGEVFLTEEESALTLQWLPADAEGEEDWAQADEDIVFVSENGAFFFDVEELVFGTTYRYRFLLECSDRTAVSATNTFSTYANVPIFTVAEPVPAGTSATISGELVFAGYEIDAADVYVLWGTADGGDNPSAWNGGAPVALPAREPGAFSATLQGLDYGTEYFCRVMVSNANDTVVWQSPAGQFTTLGAAEIGDVGAKTTAFRALTFSAEMARQGAGPTDVTCWFGESPDTLVQATNWLAQTEADTFTHTETALVLGKTYYYAFSFYSQADATHEWTVWSATNAVTLAYAVDMPAITTFTGDEDIGISADNWYTHTLDVGDVANNPSVNGVTFHSVGENGNIGDYTWSGLQSSGHPGANFDNITSPVGSGAYNLLYDFRYGHSDFTMSFGGLQSGFLYEFKFYHRPFGIGANRNQTFTFMPEGVNDTTASAIQCNSKRRNDCLPLQDRHRAARHPCRRRRRQ